MRPPPLSLLLTLCALGCASPEPKPEAPPPATPEASVKPGINERFLDPELDPNAWKERWEVESREVYAARDAILASLPVRPGQAIADVGAGTGLFLEPFSRAVGEVGQVYPVEISPRFLDHLRQRARDEGLANVTVVEGGERATKLEPGSVDLIFTCDTYHHFEYPQSMLADLYAALRPGGSLVIVDFERIPGVSRDWVLEHVRAGKAEVRAEVEAAGFKLAEAPEVPGLKENYLLRFER